MKIYIVALNSKTGDNRYLVPDQDKTRLNSRVDKILKYHRNLFDEELITLYGEVLLT